MDYVWVTEILHSGPLLPRPWSRLLRQSSYANALRHEESQTSNPKSHMHSTKCPPPQWIQKNSSSLCGLMEESWFLIEPSCECGEKDFFSESKFEPIRMQSRKGCQGFIVMGWSLFYWGEDGPSLNVSFPREGLFLEQRLYFGWGLEDGG